MPTEFPEHAAFTKHCFDLIRQTVKDTGYTPKYCIEMIHSLGGFETANQLVLGSEKTEGFTAMWDAGRLDLTIEYAVRSERWRGLFTPEVVAAAEARLKKFGG